MNPDELYSADPEKILKRAMSDVRFARSGYEAGHTTKALLLAIRGIEKMLMYHLMDRNIPFSRKSSSLRDLLQNLVNTPIHSADREDLCLILDAFQFDQEDEVMDIIQSGDQYKTLDELDEQDVENVKDHESDEVDEEESLEDWENGEWGPNGWSKGGEVDVEGFDMDVFHTGSGELEEHGEADAPSGEEPDAQNDQELPPVDELPELETMYEDALSFFKELSRMVDGDE